MVVHLLLGSKYPKICPWMSGEKRGHKISKGGNKNFGERYIPCNDLIVVVRNTKMKSYGKQYNVFMNL